MQARNLRNALQTEVYGINRDEVIHLDLEDSSCVDTEEDVDFGGCLREYAERNILNCSLPKVWGKDLVNGN